MKKHKKQRSATSAAVFCLAGLDWDNVSTMCSCCIYRQFRGAKIDQVYTVYLTYIKTWNISRNMKKMQIELGKVIARSLVTILKGVIEFNFLSKILHKSFPAIANACYHTPY